MFYVKSKINETTAINVDITDENVYTRCPECGAEFLVDFFSDWIKDENVDLCGTTVYCSECSTNGKIKSASC